MSYEDFIYEVCGRLKDKLGEDYIVYPEEVIKSNDTIMKGVMITKSKTAKKTVPIIYLEEFYKKLESLLIKYEKEGKYLLVQPIDMKHVVLSKHEASKLTYWQFNAWHWICIDKLHKDDQYSYKRLNMKSIMDELHKEKESRATTTQEVRVIQTMPMNNFEPFSSIIYHD